MQSQRRHYDNFKTSYPSDFSIKISFLIKLHFPPTNRENDDDDDHRFYCIYTCSSTDEIERRLLWCRLIEFLQLSLKMSRVKTQKSSSDHFDSLMTQFFTTRWLAHLWLLQPWAVVIKMKKVKWLLRHKNLCKRKQKLIKFF